MQDILALDEHNRVMEVASNDGAMLREFRALGIPAVGVEPARNVARLAQLEGLATVDEFMGVELAETLLSQGYPGADLIAANNVMAHVPDLDDFLNGIRMLLAPGGEFTVEFPDAALLIAENQFDQIYHEHFSYFTEHSAFDVLARRGLNVFRMDRFPIHGGTIRLTAKAGGVWEQPEHIHGAPFGHPLYADLAYAEEPPKYRRQFMEMLLKWRNEDKRIVGYGAPAKWNTMANYCGIDSSIVSYVVDSTPAKQGKFLPGSRIPVFPPEALELDNPDVIIITAWNWTQEILKKIQHHKDRGAIIVSRLDVL
jgi:SAM-dependent methyltransferase